MEITGAGARGTALYRYCADGVCAYPLESGLTTAATHAAIGPLTGVTFNFSNIGSYSTDNVYQATAAAVTDLANGVSLLQSTPGLQPLVQYGINRRLCLVFDGVDDYMYDATLDVAAPNTTATSVWWVGRQVSWTASDVLFNFNTFVPTGSTGLSVFQTVSTPRLVMFDGSVVNQNTGGVIGTDFRGYAAFTGSTSDLLQVGATSVTGASAGTTNPSAGFTLGTDGAGYANEAIYSLIVTSGTISTGDRNALTTAATDNATGYSTLLAN